MRKRILVVLGTRPECIKVAPVVAALRRHKRHDVVLVSTGQHRALVAQELAEFGLTVDHDLDVMRPDQTLAGLSARIFEGLDPLLAKEAPDLMLVQGDTTSVMVAATCAFYRRIPVGHIEAGLRTDDIQRPFPEELNRRATSLMTRLHFAPTARAQNALLAEGVPSERVFLTGNTVIDALLEKVDGLPQAKPNALRRILVTAHRRESFGAPIRNICTAITTLVERFPDIEIVFPVHPNPNVSGPVREMLDGIDRVRLTPPLGYSDLLEAMRDSHIVLSDSGGIQEEAPALGKPVLVLREETERLEAVEAGAAILVGTDADRIVFEAERLLTSERHYRSMTNAGSPYGDGTAAARIIEICSAFLEGRPHTADQFTFQGVADAA